MSPITPVAVAQDFLAAFPYIHTHQGLMNTLVDLAGVLELARVDPIGKNFVQRCHRDLVLAFAKPKSLLVALTGQRLY